MEQIILSGLTVEQLRQIIADTFKEAFKAKEQLKSKLVKAINEEHFLSRKETAKLLHISLPTLNQWTKEGILKSCRIGTRVLYKHEEIMESVTQRNFTNIKRNRF